MVFSNGGPSATERETASPTALQPYVVRATARVSAIKKNILCAYLRQCTWAQMFVRYEIKPVQYAVTSRDEQEVRGEARGQH